MAGRGRSKSAPAVLRNEPKRAAKRKQWSNEQMEAALRAVRDGQRVNQAARDHGVPVTSEGSC